MHFFYKSLRNSMNFRCSRAALDPLGGRMRPAGRVFETTDLNHAWSILSIHVNIRMCVIERTRLLQYDHIIQR